MKLVCNLGAVFACYCESIAGGKKRERMLLRYVCGFVGEFLFFFFRYSLVAYIAHQTLF